MQIYKYYIRDHRQLKKFVHNHNSLYQDFKFLKKPQQYFSFFDLIRALLIGMITAALPKHPYY